MLIDKGSCFARSVIAWSLANQTRPLSSALAVARLVGPAAALGGQRKAAKHARTQNAEEYRLLQPDFQDKQLRPCPDSYQVYPYWIWRFLRLGF